MDQNSWRGLLAAAVALVGLAGSIGWAAPAREPMAADLSGCLAAEARKLDFSGVVSVVRSGRLTTFAQGRLAGPASPPITAGAQFNLGSAGKMFTAVAVAQLIDAGKVKLDDPIGRYVEGLTPEASAVSVRQLLTHSSGLGNYFAPENLPTLIKARTLGDLLPLVAADRPAFTPGSRFAYSDTGFLLLGLLVERVSGLAYGDYLRGHVFQPAGMTASGLEPAAEPSRAVGMTTMVAPPEGSSGQGPERGPATGPGPGNDRPRLIQQDSEGPPPAGPLRSAPEAALRGGSAGGSFSTAPDMQKFFIALLRGKLTSVASLEMLVSPQIVASPAKGALAERDYGFGFGVGNFNGHRWFGHNGGAPGVNVEVTVFPDDQVAVVVLSNRDPPAATALFHDLRAMLFEPAAQQVCGLSPGQSAREETPRR
jgi:CubicO group peptidase (beta-lactamase class C family)